MVPSEACYALIKVFEQGPDGGFADRPYRCPAGYMTLGWGHRIDVSEGIGNGAITADQAQALLVKDVERFAQRVKRCVTVPLKQSMFDALVCFCYNIGTSAFAHSTLVRCLNAGLYQDASEEFLRWNKATNPRTGKKEPLAGLTRRRQAERDLFIRDGGLS